MFIRNGSPELLQPVKFKCKSCGKETSILIEEDCLVCAEKKGKLTNSKKDVKEK